MVITNQVDVLIIGAGPSGAIAAALLKKKGYDVLIIERAKFPRFSIGESLLPQCMEFIEEAGMLEAVNAGGFQYKDGAAFMQGEKHTVFNFFEQFTQGWCSTYQVQRASFDKVLADEAEKMGVPILYEQEVVKAEFDHGSPRISYRSLAGDIKVCGAKFVLDASGFGRVLPKLLALETPSDFPTRKAVFTHMEDNITDKKYDRNKIVISVHPLRKDIWFWLIPFKNGRVSLGAVGEPKFIDSYGATSLQRLQALVKSNLPLQELLKNGNYDTPANEIIGYAANVKSLYGDGYALLGNAGEFLDPIFSSGVTIAMKSASLAVTVLDKQLQGEQVDWQKEYATDLQDGVNTFRTFVEAWYAGEFQDVIFSKFSTVEVREKICSILAGYVWDKSNPYVADSKRRLGVLVELCRTM